MSEDFIVTSADDFYSYFTQVYEFHCNQSEIHTRYEVNPDIGEGYMEQIRFDNGLEFCIADFYLKKDIKVKYNMKSAPFEIHYMAEGNIFNDVKNIGQLNLSEGYISVFFRENMQGEMTYLANRHISFVTIIIHDELLETLLKSCKYAGNLHDLRHSPNINDLVKPHAPLLTLKTIFQNILTCKLSDTVRWMVLQGNATEAIAYVLQKDFFTEEIEENKKIKLDRYSLKALDMAKEYIEENMAATITIKEISESVGLNEYKLKAGFRKQHHMTIRAYQTHCRMHRAYELLQNEDCSVTEAASTVGYTNISHFAKCFKEHYGENPKHFRFGV